MEKRLLYAGKKGRCTLFPLNVAIIKGTVLVCDVGNNITQELPYNTIYHRIMRTSKEVLPSSKVLVNTNGASTPLNVGFGHVK